MSQKIINIVIYNAFNANKVKTYFEDAFYGKVLPPSSTEFQGDTKNKRSRPILLTRKNTKKISHQLERICRLQELIEIRTRSPKLG